MIRRQITELQHQGLVTSKQRQWEKNEITRLSENQTIDPMLAIQSLIDSSEFRTKVKEIMKEQMEEARASGDASGGGSESDSEDDETTDDDEDEDEGPSYDAFNSVKIKVSIIHLKTLSN